VAEGSLNHFLWAGNGMATVLGAAAWLVADVINGAAKARVANEAISAAA